MPACVLSGVGIPFQGIPASASSAEVKKLSESARLPLQPETRAAFLKALDGLRAAGATVVFDDSLLGDDFAAIVARVGTVPYIREGTEKFLGEFGPAQYRSAEDYRRQPRLERPDCPAAKRERSLPNTLEDNGV